MKNVKKTGKAFYAALMAMVLCCAMFMGTTYAWFNDTVTNTNNRIVSGILDIELYQIEKDGENITETRVTGDTDFFEGIKWEPGAVYYKNLTVKNEGDLALKYELAFNWGDYNKIDGKSLKEVLKVAVVGGHIEGTGDEAREAALGKANAAEWKGLSTKLKGEMAGKIVTEGVETIAEDKFAIIVYWKPTDSDSDYNVSNGRQTSDGEPLYVKLGLTLAAAQNGVEADSFGTAGYDSAALFPVIDEESFLAALQATKAGETIEIMQPVVINSDGETKLEDITLVGDNAGDILFKTVNGTLNMNNVTVDSTGSSYGVNVGGIMSDVAEENTTATGNLNQVTATSNSGIVVYVNNNATATLTDCTVTATTDSETPAWLNTAVATSYGGNLVIESGTYTGAKYAVYGLNTGGNITINGGTFKGSVVLKGDGSWSEPTVKTVITVNNGTFDGAIEATNGYTDITINGGTFTKFSVAKCDLATVTITGGTFDADPSEYVAANYIATQDNNTWIVTPDTVNN